MSRAKVNVDDGVIHKSRSPSSSSSSSSSSPKKRRKPLALQTTMLPADSQNLIDELAQLGFDAAGDFAFKHEAARVRQAIARAKSHPPGKIKNIPGYIRFLVTTPGPIPHPEKPVKSDNAKYHTGRYGHMVKK